MKQIECHDVCYAYDGEPVLRHVEFAIAKGEAVALTGPNGAGKSTLLRLLNGLIFPELGSYFFEGQEITKTRMAEHKFSKYFHQRMGYVWQNPDVQLFCSSVAEELAFGPVQMGLSAAEIDGRVQDALELFGLIRLQNRAPYTLSGGEKKKAALASIFTMNPQVWTLDEPLASLDDKTQDWLVEFLQALKEAGKTLLFSTHEERLLKQLADRQLLLSSQHEISFN
ncbi:putative ABC transporter ATP-binding protein (plasmid) [Selenomonas ruminantium subsp. lactilytica TAM6421]|uniref:Putative ABC transporter ATP-binding protein n=1 Tax=Selenomonas ruminantium subsp. lactilytica (strain NBRC 103574 / TAM6421) TaxID=927704 RepID=I0GVN0_SELRL|nr:ABC transporter ATP-binding protein [Selenomonas ruminantium]BAL84817.1 putative ABC transporter ATP-binding protein [Selenomonas ruminantium subsp. lactilytica TAM6421]